MKKFIIISLFSLILAKESSAQKGQFIIPFGGLNFSRILNTFDIYAENQGSKQETIKAVDTYRPVFGLDYVYNFEDEFGFQTGLIYSGNGQNYSGYLSNDPTPRFIGDTLGTDNVSYTGKVQTSYFKVPLAFRMNSPVEIQRVNMSIWVGFQVSLLNQVEVVSTTPPPPAYLMGNLPNLNQLYRKVDFSFLSGVTINVALSKKYYSILGARFDRSLIDIENKKFLTDKTVQQYLEYIKTTPSDYVFPLGTKKASYPGKNDYTTRRPSLNSTFGFYFGIGYYIKGKPSPKRELED